jgi:hypothetical protein
MYKDPIVEEIHRIRREHAETFNYDLHAICESLRKEQAASGHKVVSRPPRRPDMEARPLAVAESREKYGQ